MKRYNQLLEKQFSNEELENFVINDIIPFGYYVHGGSLDRGFVILLSKDWETAYNYSRKSGQHMWLVSPKKSTKVWDMTKSTIRSKAIKLLHKDWLAGNTSIDWIDESDFSKLENELNPRDIQNSAEFYDCVECVDWLYDRDILFINTNDGGAVLDKDCAEFIQIPDNIRQMYYS